MNWKIVFQKFVYGFAAGASAALAGGSVAAEGSIAHGVTDPRVIAAAAATGAGVGLLNAARNYLKHSDLLAHE